MAWNQDPVNYWGAEKNTESSVSGSSSELYRIPAKFYDSHQMWW
jgi:hypothetical protein